MFTVGKTHKEKQLRSRDDSKLSLVYSLWIPRYQKAISDFYWCQLSTQYSGQKYTKICLVPYSYSLLLLFLFEKSEQQQLWTVEHGGRNYTLLPLIHRKISLINIRLEGFSENKLMELPKCPMFFWKWLKT